MTSPAPDIAILFTVYKPGNEIKNTLDSLRAQTIPFRLYLVDDGSPFPPDYEALTQGIDAHITCLPKNLGRTAALNAGLGEILKHNHTYVALIDNADTCTPDRLAKQKTYLEANPDIGIVSTWVRYHFQVTGRTTESRLPTSWQACAKLLRYNAPITHTAMLVRTKIYTDVNLYSEDYPAAEDYAFECMAHAKGHRMANIPEFLMDTVEMHESISGQKRAEQVRSRLRLQLHYADWFNPHTYLGMARTLAQIILPMSLQNRLRAGAKE